MDKFAFDPNQYIGGGCTREAYASRHDPRKVVKVAKDSEGCLDNLREYRLWRQGVSAVKRHLARCYAVSRDGKLLLMERTEPPANDEQQRLLKETRWPRMLTSDAHGGNVGFVDERPVMHDYAYIGASGLTLKRSPYL